MDDLEALRALAVRLIPNLAPWGQFPGRTVLRPGKVAPELPPDVPLAAGSRIIGSLTNGGFSETLLDTDQPPQTVLRFYEQELPDRGWYRHDPPREDSMSPTEGLPVASALFCRGPQGPSLRFRAILRPSTETEVQLSVDTDSERSPCSRPAGFIPHRTRGFSESPLPALEPPPGATWQSRGDGGEGGSYFTHSTIQSDLDLAAIVAHYTRQLLEAGWEQDRAGVTGPAAWSSWTCSNEAGERVRGFFLVYQTTHRHHAWRLAREVSPTSRRQAEIEGRAQAQARRQSAAQEPASRLEIEAHDTPEAAETLHELILRTIAPIHPDDPDNANRELVAGGLPESLSVDLPLPPRARLLGSLVHGKVTTIYLESRDSTQQLLTFYRDHFLPPTWSYLGVRRELGGFVLEHRTDVQEAQFCPVSDGPAVSLSARVSSEGVTDAQIYVVMDLDGTPCGNPAAPPAWPYRGTQPSPPELVAPPESDLVFGGGSGGEASWESRAYLYTVLDLPGVAGHYARQFAAAGWTERGRGGDDVDAWRQWSRIDERGEPVEALFLAVRQPDGDAYSLIVRAGRPAG